MPKEVVYLMIQWESRGFTDKVKKMTFDKALLDKALACKTDDERDDFFEGPDFGTKNFDVMSVLGSLVGNDLTANWNKSKRVGNLDEECTWGIGLTQDDARVAFTEALGEDEDDDWEDE